MTEKIPGQTLRFADTIVRNTEKLAVLFADISDSTKLYNALGDNAARVVVNGCLTLIAEIVVRFNGRIIKTIGDEVMCVFGRADDAAAAACEMQSVIDAKRFSGYHVQVHIGLHYGPVLVEGDDVFGDTVNTAAYLRGVATAGQILTTETTERNLAPELRAGMRAEFSAVFKGSSEPSKVYQILWNTDASDLTYANFRTKAFVPVEAGSLIVSYASFRLRLDKTRPLLVFGRGDDCDVTVDEMHASRKHASLKIEQDHFYLVDHSLNGTFVTLDGGEEMRILRSELLIERSGSFALGRGVREGATAIVSFTRDRRALRPV